MTKRELIDILEALDIHDDTSVVTSDMRDIAVRAHFGLAEPFDDDETLIILSDEEEK